VLPGVARAVFLRSLNPGRNEPVKKELLVWDLAAGRAAGPMLTFAGDVHQARLSPDGAWLAVPVLRRQQMEMADLRVWEVASGRPRTPSLTAAAIQAVDFKPDGTYLLTRTKSEARLWDARTGDPVTPPLRVRGTITGHRFGAGGRLLVLQSDREAAVFDLSAEGTAEELVHAARLRSGRMIDDSGELTHLPPEMLAAVVGAGGAGPKLAAYWREVCDWHRQQAAPNEQLAQSGGLQQTAAWDAARHLGALTETAETDQERAGLLQRRAWLLLNAGEMDLALEDLAAAQGLGLDGAGFRFYRGEVYHRMGRGIEAEAEFARAFAWPDALAGPVASAGANLAVLRVNRGDEAGYRRFCGDLLKRCGQAKDPVARERTLWVCLLAPGAVERPEDLVALAERHLGDPAVNRGGALTLLAGALYRAGRHRECLQRMDEARQAGFWSAGDTHIFSILARHRLEKTALTAAEAQALRDGRLFHIWWDGLSPWRWVLDREIFRREAAALSVSP
jgi:hypothetical protein